MSLATLAVGEYPETEAQYIRDQIEAGRYVYLDERDITIRLVGAHRVGQRTRARTINGSAYWLLAPAIIRVERA